MSFQIVILRCIVIFKLKTSKETELIYKDLGTSVHLQPFALAKISIALSVRDNKMLTEEDFLTSSDGLELNRQTITGEYDDVFKALIIYKEGRLMTDEEYFPKYVKAHIDRGAKLLLGEYKYSHNRFYEHLMKLDKGV